MCHSDALILEGRGRGSPIPAFRDMKSRELWMNWGLECLNGGRDSVLASAGMAAMTALAPSAGAEIFELPECEDSRYQL